MGGTTSDPTGWAISIVKESDLNNDDIKLAVWTGSGGGMLASGTSQNNMIQLWKSDIYFSESAGVPPFHVTLSGENKFKVKYGAVNNNPPANIGTELESEGGDAYIYIVCPNGTEENSYGYPSSDLYIEVGSSVPADDDSNGHILLATYIDGVLHQVVSGSLWSERHKYTPDNPAQYYFYRV